MEGRTSAVTTGRRVGATLSTARSEGTGVAGDGLGGVISLVPFFARAKKGTRAQEARKMAAPSQSRLCVQMPT